MAVEVAELSPPATWIMIRMFCLATVIILRIIIYLVVLKLMVFLLRGDREEEEKEKEVEEKSHDGRPEIGRIQDQQNYISDKYGGSGASDSPIHKCVRGGVTESTTLEIGEITDFHDRVVIGQFVLRLIIAVTCFLLCIVYIYETQFGSSGPEYHSNPDSSNNGVSFKNYNPLERFSENHPKETNEEPSSPEFHGNENLGKVLKFKNDFKFFDSVKKEQIEVFNDEKKYGNPFALLSDQEDILKEKKPSNEDNSEDMQTDIYIPPVDKSPPTSAGSQDLKAVPFQVENNSRENIEHDSFSIIFNVTVVTIAVLLSIVFLLLIATNLMLVCYICKNNEQQ